MNTLSGRTDGTIYTARVIRTANPSRPTATAIAIREGRVLAVGTLEECQMWGITHIDNSFADKVLTAGFVEAHAHSAAGMFSNVPYVGYFPRMMADGSMSPPIASTNELIRRLQELEHDLPEGEALIVGGFDPIYVPGERLTCHDLDEVSTTRPILVYHSNGHLSTVNSFLLQKYDIGPQHPAPGVGFDDNGMPNGELRESAAMALVKDEYRLLLKRAYGPEFLLHFGTAMRNAGVTTSSDLANASLMTKETFEYTNNVTSQATFPIRIAAASHINSYINKLPALIDEITTARKNSNEKLIFPVVKLVLDGSIQGFTATVGWPGYFTGDGHPLFLVPPEQVVEILRPFHLAGIGIHCHCNGDMAAQVFIDAVETLLREHAWPDHRHTITHGQLMTHAQMRKARNLGMCANFFVNHVWFWGDQHRAMTVGPDRAEGLNPCATADRIGLSYSFHSDAPVTPPSHLHTMWAAVNRITPTGRVLGENERISVDRAFHAATIDAAYQMHIDHLVGSLEVGKFADMTVLSDDPYDVDPSTIRDIEIWGTIVGGDVHQNPSS